MLKSVQKTISIFFAARRALKQLKNLIFKIFAALMPQTQISVFFRICFAARRSFAKLKNANVRRPQSPYKSEKSDSFKTKPNHHHVFFHEQDDHLVKFEIIQLVRAPTG